MKTLVNKQNPHVRITAPEIKVNIDTQTFYIGDEMFDMDNWTLVEEKPTIVETIKEFVEKGERCMQQAVEDQNPGNYTFWDGFHNCAENILREVEEPTDDWREKRKKECPFRKADGCERYANVISECTGACSWVVDYPKLKEIQDKKKQEQPEEICPKCVYHKKDDGYCYNPNGGMKRRINENGVYECTAFWEREQEEQKPAEWSEEDENNIGKLHRLLVICQSEKKFIPTSEYEKLDKWLKSLRPQPKRKQSPALKKIVDNLTEEKLAKTRAEMKLENAAEPVDFEKEIDKTVSECTSGYNFDWDRFARHFYELGRKGGSK